MKLESVIRNAAAISVAAVLLSACSSTGQSSTGGLPAAGRALQSPLAQLPNGRVLYVGEPSDVAILKYQHQAWTKIGAISNGINSPDDTWVDRAGNLYSANSGISDNVTEYDPSGNLIFTYTTGLHYPWVGTTDKFGEVYVIDTEADTVTEYPQSSNLSFSCSLPNGNMGAGIAVDKSGDVFVTLPTARQIIEYPHGLFRSNCTPTVLPINVQATGMAIDPLGNLVVCLVSVGIINMIAPPYTSITGTLATGLAQPHLIKINRQGTQAYVTDSADRTESLQVLTYPGGSITATFNYENGGLLPQTGVSDPSYVP